MGWPKGLRRLPVTAELRSASIHVTCTEGERGEIERAARDRGLTISRYLLTCALTPASTPSSAPKKRR